MRHVIIGNAPAFTEVDSPPTHYHTQTTQKPAGRETFLLFSLRLNSEPDYLLQLKQKSCLTRATSQSLSEELPSLQLSALHFPPCSYASLSI